MSYIKDITDNLGLTGHFERLGQFARRSMLGKAFTNLDKRLGVSEGIQFEFAYQEDKRVAKGIAGLYVTRDQFRQYKVNGTLYEIFGEPKENTRHFVFGSGFVEGDARRMSKFIMTNELLSYITNEGGVVLDLDDSRNAQALDHLVEGLQPMRTRLQRLPKIVSPYDEHPRVVEQSRLLRTADLDEIRAMRDEPGSDARDFDF